MIDADQTITTRLLIYALDIITKGFNAYFETWIISVVNGENRSLIAYGN